MVRLDLTWIYGWVPDVIFFRLARKEGRKVEKAHVVGKREGWMDGWMDGWIDGWVDGWMDGYRERRWGS